VGIRGRVGHSSEGSTGGHVPAGGRRRQPMARLRSTLIFLSGIAAPALLVLVEAGMRWA